jgi:hypothetical protein
MGVLCDGARRIRRRIDEDLLREEEHPRRVAVAVDVEAQRSVGRLGEDERPNEPAPQLVELEPLPPPPADLAPPKPGTATACLGACVNGGYVTVVRQLPSGRKAGSSSSSSSSSAAGSGSGGECAVYTWAVPQVTVDGAARPLADAAAVRSDFPLQGSGAGEGRERVVAVCAHDGAQAVSVVLAGPAKAPGSHGRWLKFDCTDGRLLFERTLNPTTDTIIASAASSSSSSSSSSSFSASSSSSFDP